MKQSPTERKSSDMLESRAEVAARYQEKDPSGLDAKQPGAKLDAGKSPVYQGLFDYFPRACRAVALVSWRGAKKYSWKGWEAVEDGVNRYANAGARHVLDESIQGPIDPDGFLHRAQKAWNALAELELFLREHPEYKEHWQ